MNRSLTIGLILLFIISNQSYGGTVPFVFCKFQSVINQVESYIVVFKFESVRKVDGSELSYLGAVYFKRPNKFRIDITSNELDNKSYYYKDEEFVSLKGSFENSQEVRLVGNGIDSDLILSIVNGNIDMEDDFIIAFVGEDGDEYKFDLTPVEPDSFMMQLFVWVDKNSLLPRKIEYYDFYWNKTSLVFLLFETHAYLNDGLFDVESLTRLSTPLH